jgi:hypothetical protein
MSGRLDQSLDSIIDSQKKAKREQQRRRKPVKKAPVGGVKKAVKPTKPALKSGGASAGQTQASKIVVSGLVSSKVSLIVMSLIHHSHTTSMRPKSRYVDEEAQGPWISIAIYLLRSYIHFQEMVGEKDEVLAQSIPAQATPLEGFATDLADTPVSREILAGLRLDVEREIAHFRDWKLNLSDSAQTAT